MKQLAKNQAKKEGLKQGRSFDTKQGHLPAGKNGPPLNWLAWLDEKAPSLPPEKGALRYPYFMRARYPHLPALDPPELPLRIITVNRAIEKTVANSLARLAKSGAADVLIGLSSPLKLQLAALLEDFDRERRSSQARRRLASFSPGSGRKLERKVAAARKNLEALRSYVADQDLLGGSEFEIPANECLQLLAGAIPSPSDPWRAPTVQKDIDALFPISVSPTSAMVLFYWFFRHGCENISGDEAEIRVGLIRNELWTELGVKPVPFRLHAEFGESRGCDAVHQAVLRFRLEQGTSPK